MGRFAAAIFASSASSLSKFCSLASTTNGLTRSHFSTVGWSIRQVICVFPSLLREEDGHLELVHLVEMPEDDTLRRHDFVEDAVIRIVRAVGPVHDEAPVAARSKVEFAEGIREAFRPPPIRKMARVAEGLGRQARAGRRLGAMRRSRDRRSGSAWRSVAIVMTDPSRNSGDSAFYDGLEAAVSHALAVKRHRVLLAHRLDARVCHDLGVHFVAMFARLIDDP